MPNIIDNHPITTNSKEITAICSPLKMLNISYFSQVKVDVDGNFSVICNNPKFIEHYIKKEYYNSDIHMAEKNVFRNFVVWDAVERHGQTKQMELDAAEFGVMHTFTIIDQSKNGADYYHFSSDTYNPSANQVFLSNIDMLKSFVSHFNEAISQDKSLQNAHNIKFKLDRSKGNYEFNKEIILPVSEIKKINFIKSLNYNPIQHQNKKLIQTLKTSFTKMTDREAQIALLMVKGKPVRVIAENLNLAYKTIEHYIENIKFKLGAESKMELVGMFVDELLIKMD